MKRHLLAAAAVGALMLSPALAAEDETFGSEANETLDFSEQMQEPAEGTALEGQDDAVRVEPGTGPTESVESAIPEMGEDLSGGAKVGEKQDSVEIEPGSGPTESISEALPKQTDDEESAGAAHAEHDEDESAPKAD